MRHAAGTLATLGLCAVLGLAPAGVGAQEKTTLHEAAGTGDVELLRSLLEKGAAVDAVDGNGGTPLHYASGRGQVATVRLLLTRGAAVDALAPGGKTALSLAAEQGHLEAVRALVAGKADLEHRDDRGRTPLVAAARERGGVAVVRALLDAGARIDPTDGSGDTALSLAAWRGFGDVVDLLLDRGAPLPADPAGQGTLLGYAVSKGLTRLFTTLVERKVDLGQRNAKGQTALHLAARGGSVPILEALLGKGLDPRVGDQDGWTPLHEAASLDRAEAVKVLFGKGAAIDARTVMGQTAWNLADESGSPETAAVLAQAGADRSAPRFPALTGPYLGQGMPAPSPAPFAPGIVSGHHNLHADVVFSPDGKEAFWTIMPPARGSGYGSSHTVVSRFVNGRWSYPVRAVLAGLAVEDVPLFSPDGSRFYDMANRPLAEGQAPGKENVWVWQRRDGGWADPRPLDAVVNRHPVHWQFGVDREQNLYLPLNVPGTLGRSDIYVFRFSGGKYLEPENLGPGVNTASSEECPFVAPDGSYLLFGRDSDLHVSFREKGGRWGTAVPLGPEVNTPALELLPVVSPDGKALFFLRGWAAWWVDAGVVERLRPPPRRD